MRIVVKNLPLKTKEEELKVFFEKVGTVTDVFMLMNKDNVFRRIAFIGFSDPEVAKKACDYYNSAYFHNHKITVELAKDEDKAIEYSESKLRKALYSKTIVISNLTSAISEERLISELEKYGRVVSTDLQPKNDKVVAVVKFKEGEVAEKVLKSLKVVAGVRVKVGNFVEKIVDTKREYYNSLFFNFESVVKRTCESEKISRRDLINLNDNDLGARMSLLESNLVEQTKRFLVENGIYLDNIVGKSKNTLILRNPDILGVLELVKGNYKISIAPSKCLALLVFDSPNDAEKAYKSVNMKRFKNQVVYCEFAPICEIPDNDTEKLAKNTDTNKIIVKNVPFQATEEDLKKIFSSFTDITEIRLPKKPDGSHRGFAFLVLSSPQNVSMLIDHFNTSTHLFGRRLVLEKAKL